jgi:hypothetical protein
MVLRTNGGNRGCVTFIVLFPDPNSTIIELWNKTGHMPHRKPIKEQFLLDYIVIIMTGLCHKAYITCNNLL